MITITQSDFNILDTAHAEVFRPVTVQHYNNHKSAQVTVQVGSKSYTRHLKLVNGIWRGNAIFGSGTMDYRL